MDKRRSVHKVWIVIEIINLTPDKITCYLRISFGNRLNFFRAYSVRMPAGEKVIGGQVAKYVRLCLIGNFQLSQYVS